MEYFNFQMSERVEGLSDEDDCDYDDQDYVDDYDPPKKKKKKSKKTDLMKMSGNLLSNINYKVAFLLFIVSMILFSDVFIESVLGRFSGTVDGDCTTTKGTMLQLLFMVVAYIILDLIVKYDIL